VTGWRAAAAGATCAALALAPVACGGNTPTSAATATDRLEVVSWWTSGSEAKALDALFAAFRQSTPDVEALNAAVAGGAGSNARVALAKRLQKDDPPDVWQTFAGESVQGSARRGVVRSVAAIYQSEDLRTRMHPTILRSVMRKNRPYGVPTGAHRSNVLWFNRRLLERAGVQPPSSGYTLAAFLTDLEKVKASGAVALCLGGKDRFTTVELFEHTLLSRIGERGWKDMIDDDLDWRGDRVQTALQQFGTMLRYSDPQASDLTWDAATKKLASGGCAFESMNDSAFGESSRPAQRRARTSDRSPSRGPTRASWPSSTSSWPRRRRRTPRTRWRSSATSAGRPRSLRSTGQRGRCRSCATSTSHRCRATSGRPPSACGTRRCSCRSPTARR
jgi:glucose/mannose transport system substrate-binding protein